MPTALSIRARMSLGLRRREIRMHGFIHRFGLPALICMMLLAGCGSGSGSSNSRPAVGGIGDQTVVEGQTLRLSIAVADADAEDRHSLNASSSDAAVARVAVDGMRLALTGIAPGTATISVTARDNSGADNAESLPATFMATVEAANARPTLGSIEDQTLAVGQRLSLSMAVADEDAEDTHVLSASSSDSAVAQASVDGATVRLSGIAPGMATISVTATDSSGADNAESQPAEFQVTVESASLWTPGVFQPAAQFEARCANPRPGIDPRTGAPYPDALGETLDENNWLRSWSNDLYLWYDEIEDRDPGQYDDPLAYFELLKTFARTRSGAPKDRFHFTYTTEEWRKLSGQGRSVGYGARFVLLRASPPRDVRIAYVEPNSPAARASLGRGARILSIDGFDVQSANAREAVDALNAGLYPSSEGETHEFSVQDLGSDEPRSVTLRATEIESDPVQHVQVLNTDSGPVGYMLFNAFIAPAERELIDAARDLEARNITDLVLDLRYNGGGYLDIASQLGFMVAGPSAAQGRVFETLRFNDKHRSRNPITGELLRPALFHATSIGLTVPSGRPLPSLNLPRVFVLTGPGTCSASESVINSLRGIDLEVIQIGATTCGKPYGFYATDNCGTTYFSIQFQGVNAKGFGDYPDGFSPANLPGVEGTELPGCAVADDFEHRLGDLQEARLQAALRYRADGDCPAPSGLAARPAQWSLGQPGLAIAEPPALLHGVKIPLPPHRRVDVH